MAKVRFDYFDALERQGEYACEEAKKLVDVLRDFRPSTLPEHLEAMHEIENAADNQNHEIFTHLAKEFITPIDREDIIEMAHRLDDIVDYTEDVLQQIYMYDIQTLYERALPMAVLMERATTALYGALGEFRNFKKGKALSERVIEVNDYEEEADKLYTESIRDLYRNHVDDPVYILMWSNVFSRMERCIDACENVADMMSTILLKNS
jgi:predicted phosphate transport protein (TIGR00153 family)